MDSEAWENFQMDLKRDLAQNARGLHGLGSAMTDRVNLVDPFLALRPDEKAVIYHSTLLKAASDFRDKVDVTGQMV